jgi:hypothetical protein
MSRDAAAARPADLLLVAAAALLLALSLFGNLSHPLLWSDEADTAVFAERVLEYGYPKVHGAKNVSYQFGTNIALGVKESIDAYIGTTWAQFYFAAPAVAWAARVDDPYVRTARLRLPFAATGALAIAAGLWAVWPALAGTARGQKLRFAAAQLALAALSISFVLHLREVRYPALLALELALCCGLALRSEIYSALSARRYAVAQALLLFGIFHTFFSAYFALAALLAARGLWHRVAQRAQGTPHLAAALLSAALVAPCAFFFETFEIAVTFSRELGLTPERYASNLAWVIAHLARHELLLPALGARIAATLAAERDARTRSAAFLLYVAMGYTFLASANPLVYERYFAPLSPLFGLAFLLDASALAAKRALRAVLLAAALASLALRAPELLGHARELREPVRGPLDFAIEHLRAHHPDPASLVIATNYEEQVLMYYLGSHVIIGLTGNNLLRDRALAPDVVLPRRRWSTQLPELERFRARGRFELTRLPVEDTRFNQIAALSRSELLPETHRFATAQTDDPRLQLEIYERAIDVDDSERSGAARVAPGP